jgi:Cu/Zn superoxide dismutase
MQGMALALVTVLAAGCARTVKVETDPASGRVDVDYQRAGSAEAWNASLAARNGSGVTGTATATSRSDMTHVSARVNGARPGARLPWHIHEGTCGDASPPMVGDASAYPPLVVGSDGRATAEAHLALNLNEAKNYIVNIHASPTDLGTIVSCGDLND